MKSAAPVGVVFSLLFMLFCNFQLQASNNTPLLDVTVEIYWWHFAIEYASFPATDQSDAVLTVTNMTPDKFYCGFLALNSETFQLANDDTFTQNVFLENENHMLIFLLGFSGTAIHIEVTPLQAVPVISSFTAAPNTIVCGDSSTLSWSTENSDTVTITPGIGDVPASGSIQVSPDTTTTYTLTASNSAGTVSETTTLTVLFPPEITLIEPDGVHDSADATYTILWQDQDPDSNASIALFYDADNAGADGTLITSGIEEDPDGAGDQFTWDTSSLA